MENPYNKARVLFVDDEQSVLDSIRRATRKLKADISFVNNPLEALKLFEDEPFDVVVSDMKMPEMDGATLLAKIAKQYPESIRIVLSGYSEENLIMTAINEGKIWGYIHKPWNNSDLMHAINQALRMQQIIAERALLKRTVACFEEKEKTEFGKFIGSSPVMQDVYSKILRAAPSTASIFIKGESGTGKELAAEAIHDYSQRARKPFYALNCAAIPAELLESEIFGHVKGAFSGATSNREGLASLCHEGTLFLDELGEMDINLQAKLLRFIQTGSFSKVGSSKVEKVDVRFVCATNREPEEAIANNQLRQDLFYRLSVITIALPPLRDRKQDALQIASCFLNSFSDRERKMFSGFSRDAEATMLSYPWPGNVRQLENAIHGITIMNDGPLVTQEMLLEQLNISDDNQLLTASVQATEKEAVAQNKPVETGIVTVCDPVNVEAIIPLYLQERRAIENAIENCSGNVVSAAKALEVSPSTLYRKIQSWEKLT